MKQNGKSGRSLISNHIEIGTWYKGLPITPAMDLHSNGIVIGTNGRLNDEDRSITFDYTPEGLQHLRNPVALTLHPNSMAHKNDPRDRITPEDHLAPGEFLDDYAADLLGEVLIINGRAVCPQCGGLGCDECE